MDGAGGESGKAQAFQGFWEAGAPLVGDEGGQGWAAWEANQVFTPGKTAATPSSNGAAGTVCSHGFTLDQDLQRGSSVSENLKQKWGHRWGGLNK